MGLSLFVALCPHVAMIGLSHGQMGWHEPIGVYLRASAVE
jgi:hypothetical protein